jgi:hypothetical protein
MVLDSKRASYSTTSNANDNLLLTPKGPEGCFRNTIMLANSGEERPSTAESTKESTLAVEVKYACLLPPPTYSVWP